MEPIPLTTEDRAILDLEGPTVAGHTAKVVILAAPAPRLEELRGLVARRLGSVPELRRRLAEIDGAPVWVEGDLDPELHVISGGSDPLARKDLPRAVSSVFEQHLDRRFPLWRIDRFDLADGRAALVWRIHHALADGTTAMRLARGLLWDENPSSGTAGPARGGSARRGGEHPDEHRRRAHLAALLRREFAESLHRSPFDGRIGRRRAVQTVALSLERLHSAAHRVEATLNDAVLSVLSGALGHWLEHHHGHLGSLRLRVPVSLHREGEDAGNRDSFFTIAAPLGERDPLARLEAVREATAVRKHEHDAEALDGLIRELEGTSGRLAELAKRLEASPRSFALSVSNVPGPREPVSVLGRPVEELFTLAEIGERHALRVAAVSLADRLCFGLCADPAIVEDLDEMARGIDAEATELIRAAGA